MSTKIKIQHAKAKILFSLCMFLCVEIVSAQHSTLNFYLSSRNCSNCIHYTKLLNKLPYHIPSKIVTDVPLKSVEFDYLIDSVTEIDRSRYEFEYRKEISLDLLNQLQVINENGEILYQNTILSLSSEQDSILRYWNNHVLMSYKIKSKFPLFSGTDLIQNDDSTIFCYSYTADRLLHIDLKSKNEYEYTPKQINLSDVFELIYSDPIKAKEAYNIVSNSEGVFKRIQIDNFFSTNDTAYIMYRITVPILFSSESEKDTYQYIYKYIIGLFYKGNLLELLPIVGQIDFSSFCIDTEKYYIQSMAIADGIFKVEPNKDIIVGVSLTKYTTSNQKYFARFERKGKQYVYSNRQTYISNTHLKDLSKLLSKESMDDYNFSNFRSYRNGYLFFSRQFILYNLKNKSWIPLKFNNPNLDTLKIKPKNFSSHFFIDGNVIKTLNFVKIQNQSCFILYTFNSLGNLLQTDTIILDGKCVLSTPYLTKNGITIIDNDGVIRMYKYSYVPILYNTLRARKFDD